MDNSQFGEIYLPIQRLVVHWGREYGGLHLPFQLRTVERAVIVVRLQRSE